jgi:L-ascorbate metabolism protein UlaG (beta-lactamase superfamily)
MIRRLTWALCLLAAITPANADSRMQSSCIALAGMPADLHLAAFGDPLDQGVVRIRFLGHASFALETPGGVVAVTDYTGYIGNPEVVPDVVTMNIAHDTHYTDTPDPLIPHVLRGWGPFGTPAVVDLEVGDLRIRNVTTDLRGPFGEGGRKDGNSVFIFETAGLCIVHLGHLHQIPSAAQYASIGRVDVLMVPVDGGYTLDLDSLVGVVRRLRPRIVLPMHWFNGAGLTRFQAAMLADFEQLAPGGPEIEVGLDLLPDAPQMLILDPALIP